MLAPELMVALPWWRELSWRDQLRWERGSASSTGALGGVSGGGAGWALAGGGGGSGWGGGGWGAWGGGGSPVGSARSRGGWGCGGGVGFWGGCGVGGVGGVEAGDAAVEPEVGGGGEVGGGFQVEEDSDVVAAGLVDEVVEIVEGAEGGVDGLGLWRGVG